MNNLNKALQFAFAAEGGYSNHKNDKGGSTNLGITQKTFDSAKEKGVIDTDITDVKYITKDLALEIYKKNYWDPIKADQLPNGIDVALFDMAINSGQKNAVKTLQKAIGVTSDGLIGPNTLNAIKNYEGDLVKDFNNQRREFYNSIIEKDPSQSVFEKGWKNRVNNLDKFIKENIPKNTENILEKSNESFISTNHIYKIQKGDTLSKIAQNNNITVDKLVENNPWLIEENRVNENGNYALIKVGEKLNLTNNNSEREPSAVKELWEYISKNGINLNDIKSFLEEVKKEHHIKDEVSSEEFNQSFNNYRQ